MDSRKIKIARIIGVGFLVLGIGYWVASFFLPNTYTNERPSEDAVFSTKVVSREDAESETRATSAVPRQELPDDKPLGGGVKDPVGPHTSGKVEIPPALQPPA